MANGFESKQPDRHGPQTPNWDTTRGLYHRGYACRWEREGESEWEWERTPEIFMAYRYCSFRCWQAILWLMFV